MNWRRPSGQWVLNQRQPLTSCVIAGEPRVPLECANCGQASTQAVRCASPRVQSRLLVPYCSRCYKSLEAGKTRVMLVVCSSLLLGTSSLLLVPLCAWDVSSGLYALVTFVASSVPLIWGFGLRPRPAEGQTSADLAVWFESRAVVGTNQQWMDQLARDNDGFSSRRLGRTPLWTWPTTSPALLLPLLAFGLHELFYPTLVVLNLSVGEFDFWVDGQYKTTVGVSSLESSHAASRMTLPAGRHQFEARLTGEGELLQAADVELDAFGMYLFAPGAVGHCFWTEAVSYGKNQARPVKHRLGPKDGFIVLPPRVDSWFTPNPPDNDDRRSSGGEMVALRHGLCSEQPTDE